MTLYIDGDAFPNLLKTIVLKAINKNEIDTIVIANKKIDIGSSSFISYKIVAQGADEADKEIVNLCTPNDIVITADIPLADQIVSKNAIALDHRGLVYDVDNIKQCLAIRDLMQGIRDSGEITKGPKRFSKKDCQNFANSFNQLIQKEKN